jgi:hypothetical protein
MVVREGGIIVRLHGPPREHPPPHVDVDYALRYHDALRACQIVGKHLDLIYQVWRLLHG